MGWQRWAQQPDREVGFRVATRRSEEASEGYESTCEATASVCLGGVRLSETAHAADFDSAADEAISQLRKRLMEAVE